MSSCCSGGICQCPEKDKQILQFKSQIDRLQSKKLMLQATNVHLREQLDDCTRELEAHLTFKEDKVQALRGICKAMSSHVLSCQEKAVALQEELLKKEELLRAAGSLNSSFNSSPKWTPNRSPSADSPVSPTSPRSARSSRSMHSICIQTSPRQEEVERTTSCTSEDLRSVSPRSETSPCSVEASIAEVQELRFTVQVLKEQLEELQLTPPAPCHAASPKADRSGWTSPAISLSPMNRLPRTPVSNQSGRSPAESCLEGSTLECQVLQTLLASDLFAAEAIGRQVIGLEHDGALREATMMHDSFLTQHQLLLDGLWQLQRLEACERDHLVEAERSFRKTVNDETAESTRPAAPCGRPSRVPLGDAGLGTALEPHIIAYEAMGRNAIVLEEECSLQALMMYGDWHRAQSKLCAAATRQLTMLKGAQRCRHSRLVNAELCFHRCVLRSHIVQEAEWGLLLQDDPERPQTPQWMSSKASSVGEDFCSTLMTEEQEPWVLHGHPAVASTTSSTDGPRTPLSSLRSCNWDHTPVRTLLSRQQRAFKLLVQHEGNEWTRLIWLSEVELTRCLYNALLQIQLSCGRLAEDIESEETAGRKSLKEQFQAELLECLKRLAKCRCNRKVCGVWENERWMPLMGWGKALLGRPPFSDLTGRVALDLSAFDSIIARECLCWSSEGWELDISSLVDHEGWQYALSFDSPFHPGPWPLALVRRRKWVRACEPLPFVKPANGATCEAPSTPVPSFAADGFGELVDADFMMIDAWLTEEEAATRGLQAL